MTAPANPPVAPPPPTAPQPDATPPITAPVSVAAVVAAVPIGDDELRTLLREPGRAFDLLLGNRERLAATIRDDRPPRTLCLALLVATVLASLPFGLVHGGAAAWKIAALLGGSVLLCWPSLQVFASYLGTPLRPAQSLALALTIAAVAALFTLGFAPILWFLRVTMTAGDHIDATDAACGMLALALLAGLWQLARCSGADARLRNHRSFVLLLVWQLLVVFVAVRMARALALFA